MFLKFKSLIHSYMKLKHQRTQRLQKTLFHSIPFNINIKWSTCIIVMVMTTNGPYTQFALTSSDYHYHWNYLFNVHSPMLLVKILLNQPIDIILPSIGQKFHVDENIENQINKLLCTKTEMCPSSRSRYIKFRNINQSNY